MNLPKLLFRVDEAGYMLSCKRTKIYELVRKGELELHNDTPGEKGGRITAESILVYVEKYKRTLPKELIIFRKIF